VNNIQVTTAADLRNLVGLVRVGGELTMTVVRDGARRKIRVRVGALKRVTYAGSESSPQLSGAVFQAMGDDHPLHGQIDGVVVADVTRNSRAWRNNVRPGDIIIAINRERVRSVEELNRAMRRTGRTIAVDVIRGKMQLLIVIQ
jgi:serine protease Do/serine protease DegQ